MKEWLSHLELSKFAGIPESTSRRYVTLFSAYFRTEEGIRGRKYHAEGATILQRIQDLYQEGYSTENIETELAKDFPRYVEDIKPQTEVSTRNVAELASREDILNALSQIGELYQDLTDEMKELRAEIAAAKSVAIETQKENQQLKHYIENTVNERDRLLMETLRNIQKQTEESLKEEPRKRRLWPFNKRSSP
ncbi:hypothetical protein LLE49_27165 [Alicyclobacillus tolerans]|uniref:hypothetical protein n=1 Tax=Alicyclobacillus tolerans TaxID=90970 RepID=UPI001F173431|nr:hypothetical protein [Alicyclobacillus tolerans]MCF8568403.1 hypothetical protein [Alicyclobacillus tolerans]